jgi:hypothetical protein
MLCEATENKEEGNGESNRWPRTVIHSLFGSIVYCIVLNNVCDLLIMTTESGFFWNKKDKTEEEKYGVAFFFHWGEMGRGGRGRGREVN